MAEDRDLVVLLKAGNADALEQLIVRWRSRAEAYATSILHDSQSAIVHSRTDSHEQLLCGREFQRHCRPEGFR